MTRVIQAATEAANAQMYAAHRQALMTPVFNAEGYGAAKDGITNDHAVLQAMLNNADSIAFLPPGTYNIGTSSLRVKNRGAILQGAGANQTIIKYTGTDAAIVVESEIENDEPHNVVIRDLKIDGQDTGAYGLRIGKATGTPRAARGLFENLLITGCTTAGYWLVSCQIATFINCEAEENPGIGFLLDNPSGGANTATTFYNCRAHKNGQQGVYIKDCFLTINFYNLVSEVNGYEGLCVDSLTREMFNLRFDNLHCERNNNATGRSSGYYEVYVDSGAFPIRALQIRGAYLDIGSQTQNHALYMAGSGTALIDGFVATASVSGPTYGTISGTWTIRGFGLGSASLTVANTVRGHFFDVGGDGRLVIESTKSDAKQNYVAFGYGVESGRGFLLGTKKHTFGTQTPAFGSDTWAVGDVCWNTNPTPGGALNWVCTTAGTPGSWRIGAIAEGWVTINNAGATPDVLDKQQIILTQSGATNVTNFVNGYDGAKLVIRAGDGNTTLVHGAMISLRSGANVTLSTGQIIVLYRVGTVWTQTL